MKGLILSAMNKREEALELARKGLSKNFRSGTCWHVYGLVLRAEKKYEEAVERLRTLIRTCPDAPAADKSGAEPAVEGSSAKPAEEPEL